MSILAQAAPRVQAKSTRRPITVEMVITINGQAYHVEPIAHAPGGLKSFRLAKVGGDSAVYDVDAHADRIVCTCPSYTKTHEGTSSLCKHGRALVMVGLVDYPDVAEQPALASVHVPDEFDEPINGASGAPFTHAPYDGHLEKLAALEVAEATVRAEAEVKDDIVTLDQPARVDPRLNRDIVTVQPTPAFDADFYRAQNAVAERRALWIAHRHLHAPEPETHVETLMGRKSDNITLADDAPANGAGQLARTVEPRLIDDDGTPLETPSEMDRRHREEHAAKVAEDLEGNPFPPACCPVDEVLPCSACLSHDGPADLSDDGWDDDERWELGPDDEPFAAWLDHQADAFAAIGSPRASWLAGKIAKLAEQARFLDAATPDAFDDRLQAQLDAACDAAEARMASRCD